MTSGNPSSEDLRHELNRLAVWRANCLDGDEKGEAQIFLDRLFRAFGHEGSKEAGATLEYRLKKDDGKGTSFADLMWKPRCLIEMKRAGVDLKKHYRQAFDYWVAAVPDRPRYVVLCNFDQFWVYDFDSQLDEPVDRVTLADLASRWESLAFMLPVPVKPQFGNDLVEVTRDAAARVARVFNSLQERGIDRTKAQTVTLQSVMAMFSEDIGLLPSHLFTAALDDALASPSAKDVAFDLVFGLFREMNTVGVTAGGRFAGTPYFNGGLFSDVEPVALTNTELEDLRHAAGTNWAAVRPEIFGTLFEQSMDAGERHAYGAHFTSQADIAKIVIPTIVTPWRQRIAEARTRGKGGIRAMERLLLDMSSFRVLDPAVGSGNFLYVAYRELRRLEHEALAVIAEMRNSPDIAAQRAFAYVSTDHFYGMDVNKFAVEVAKVTMMLGKKLSADELEDDQDVLPLDNLDGTIVASDALFDVWPKADVIIGNPPYLGRRKMVQELGADYCRRLAAAHPAVGGVSDFVTYWFPLAHDHLMDGGRAGFVATNTIRQNESREASLDYVVDHGGVIFDAVSSQPWSGDAAVHVSIVNWIKNQDVPEKILWLNDGDLRLPVESIPPSLSPDIDVRKAAPLLVNRKPATCFQGQTPGVTKGFVLTEPETNALVEECDYLHPFLGGTELLNKTKIDRWVIDLPFNDALVAETAAPAIMSHLRAKVLPEREKAAMAEAQRSAEVLSEDPLARPNRHHAAFLSRWWRLGYRREDMLDCLETLDRYIATSRVAPRDRLSVFEFVDTNIRPGDSLTVFALDDDYSFGVLSSSLHRKWLEARCSTLKGDWRYTSSTVWDSFPWPQSPAAREVKDIADVVKKLIGLRSGYLDKGVSLAKQYDVLREPGTSALRSVHIELDEAVVRAYNFSKSDDFLVQLFALNQDLGSDPAAQGPGASRSASTSSGLYRLTAPPLC